MQNFKLSDPLAAHLVGMAKLQSDSVDFDVVAFLSLMKGSFDTS